MERVITEEMLGNFAVWLAEEEKSAQTVGKYMCDACKLFDYAAGREITKELVIEFKEKLLGGGNYELSSINSFLAAVNCFLEFMGWRDACVKAYRLQRPTFAPEGKHLAREEYECLVDAARKRGNGRLALILVTLCATGIRISELSSITAESVCCGKAVINNKGKIREVLLPTELQGRLKAYMEERGIADGPVFCTGKGNPVDRSNVWRDMKSLCEEAGVAAGKVFPHNLRRLFARCFYAAGKDIAKLADVLGHGNIETTRLYLRMPCEGCREEIDGLGLVV